MNKKQLGIIGLGFVGGAVESFYKDNSNIELFRYDKFKEIGSIEEVNKADYIFICVPTPYENGGYDDSAVLDALSNIEAGKTAILKSTVLPGSTEKFQKQFSKLKILFNPEFLVQAKAKEGFAKPDRQIVGYTEKSESEAEKVMELLPDAPFKKTMPASEAELGKYFANCFLATKVIFANQIFDIAQKLGINYDNAKEVAANDPRIGKSHLDVNFDQYRGYGGACFPKDVRSLIQFAQNLGLDPKLLKTAEEINKELNGGDK